MLLYKIFFSNSICRHSNSQKLYNVCYSSLMVSCGQIPCSHENLYTRNYEGSAIL